MEKPNFESFLGTIRDKAAEQITALGPRGLAMSAILGTTIAGGLRCTEELWQSKLETAAYASEGCEPARAELVAQYDEYIRMPGDESLYDTIPQLDYYMESDNIDSYAADVRREIDYRTTVANKNGLHLYDYYDDIADLLPQTSESLASIPTDILLERVRDVSSAFNVKITFPESITTDYSLDVRPLNEATFLAQDSSGNNLRLFNLLTNLGNLPQEAIELMGLTEIRFIQSDDASGFVTQQEPGVIFLNGNSHYDDTFFHEAGHLLDHAACGDNRTTTKDPQFEATNNGRDYTYEEYRSNGEAFTVNTFDTVIYDTDYGALAANVRSDENSLFYETDPLPIAPFSLSANLPPRTSTIVDDIYYYEPYGTTNVIEDKATIFAPMLRGDTFLSIYHIPAIREKYLELLARLPDQRVAQYLLEVDVERGKKMIS